MVGITTRPKGRNMKSKLWFAFRIFNFIVGITTSSDNVHPSEQLWFAFRIFNFMVGITTDTAARSNYYQLWFAFRIFNFMVGITTFSYREFEASQLWFAFRIFNFMVGITTIARAIAIARALWFAFRIFNFMVGITTFSLQAVEKQWFKSCCLIKKSGRFLSGFFCILFGFWILSWAWGSDSFKLYVSEICGMPLFPRVIQDKCCLTAAPGISSEQLQLNIEILALLWLMFGKQLHVSELLVRNA